MSRSAGASWSAATFRACSSGSGLRGEPMQPAKLSSSARGPRGADVEDLEVVREAGRGARASSYSLNVTYVSHVRNLRVGRRTVGRVAEAPRGTVLAWAPWSRRSWQVCGWSGHGSGSSTPCAGRGGPARAVWPPATAGAARRRGDLHSRGGRGAPAGARAFPRARGGRRSRERAGSPRRADERR